MTFNLLGHSDLILYCSCAPEGWTVTPTGSAPSELAAETTATQTWTVNAPAGPAPIAVVAIQVNAASDTGTSQQTIAVALSQAPVQPPLLTTGNAGYVAGQLGDTYALWEAGADMWGVGQHDDQYASIYAPNSFGDGSTMTATVTSQDAVNQWTESGLVLRNDLTVPFSAGGYLALLVTPSQSVLLSSDANNDGLLDTNSIKTGIKAPVTLKLARVGTNVTGSYSKDNGQTWTVVGTVALPSAAAKQDAGSVHVTHDVNKFGLANFSGLTYSPALPAAPSAPEPPSITVSGADATVAWQCAEGTLPRRSTEARSGPAVAELKVASEF